ncbi:kinesin-like protein KIF2A, partial [Saccoglossus kowalevskii]
MSFASLKVGLSVDIQRTDGRVHSAVISGANEAAQSVTVEWFEKGETKGKEIEVDQIFALNPELVAPPPPVRASKKTGRGDVDLARTEENKPIKAPRHEPSK